jgi:hypothetical protein
VSSGLATFFRPDGTVAGYGVYFGTADVLLSLAAGTPEAAWAAERSSAHPDCTCGHPAEPVVMVCDPCLDEMTAEMRERKQRGKGRTDG